MKHFFNAVPPLKTGVPTGEAMEQAVREATAAAARLLNEYAPVTVTCERYAEKEPHPGGQEAFAIRVQLPWQRRPQTRVIIEVSVDERILRAASRKPILHEYGEALEASASVYALEEIVAEKLRAILQHIEKLSNSGPPPISSSTRCWLMWRERGSNGWGRWSRTYPASRR